MESTAFMYDIAATMHEVLAPLIRRRERELQARREAAWRRYKDAMRLADNARLMWGGASFAYNYAKHLELERLAAYQELPRWLPLPRSLR